MNKYNDWIERNVKDGGYGECSKMTEAMVKEFPELTRIRGHYYCMIWGERGHWWCETDNGEIIDPTAAQFPTKGKGVYVPWVENAEEPTGMCPECGGYCYDGKYFCSDDCERSYMAYINGGPL